MNSDYNTRNQLAFSFAAFRAFNKRARFPMLNYQFPIEHKHHVPRMKETMGER